MADKDIKTDVGFPAQSTNDERSPSSPPTDQRATNGQPTDRDTPTQWCGNCKTNVAARGSGLCPQCGRFLRRNSGARRHPINITRRNQRLAKVKVDYQVDESSTVRTAWAEALADILEQLVSTRAGTMEHQRLISLSKELDAELRASRASQSEEGKSPIEEAAAAIAALSEDEAIQKIESLLAVFKADRDARKAREAALAAEASAPKLKTPTATPEPVTSAAPTACPYCRHMPCVGPDDPLYRDYHYNDPAEIERRGNERTKEMMNRIGKPLPPWFRN